MTDDDLKYKIAFSRLPGMNVRLGRELLPRIGGERQFFGASASALSAVMSFSSRLFSDGLRQKALSEATVECGFITMNHIRALYFDSPGYPQALLECDDAPVMLYQLGSLDLNSVGCLSIVGTRHSTAYGTGFVSKLVASLAATVAEPVAIVSGLAYGIDVAAHRASLENDIPTVGVLAHGLSMIYPAVHRSVAAEIVAKGGALLTEYVSKDPVHKGNFLARNRIVAGLSSATLVAESDVKGGALVTARLALDYGRDVMALPGRVNDKYSRGCNSLIERNVASIVTSPDQVIDSLGWKRRDREGLQQELFKELNTLEQQIVNTLTEYGEQRLDELQNRIAVPTARLMATLIDMEFREIITAIPGGRYRLG